MPFKDQLNEIFGIGAPTVAIPQEKPRDVIELTTIDDFRNNIRAKLNGIKSSVVQGVVTGTSIQTPPVESSPCCGVLTEREKEIGLDTLKGSIRQMGPKKVSEAIAKLSVDKTEVDKDTGIATSAFDKFVDGLKQEAIESIMGTTPSTNTDTQVATNTEVSSEETPVENKPSTEKLPDLVKTKL